MHPATYKIPRRFLALCLILVLCCSLLTYGDAKAQQKEEVRLKLWQFWPEKWIEPELLRFEEETGIQVDVERLTWSDGLNKIITALAANQAPDVIEIGSTWVVGFSQDGGIRPLEVEDLKDELNLWKPAVYGQKTYAVPWTLSTGALFYNPGLLEKAGIVRPPKNWEELLEASRKIQALGEGIYGYGLKTGSYSTWQKFLPFAWSNGAVLFDPVTKKVMTTDPAFLEAVEFYLELKKAGLYDDNLAVRKAFQEGRVGFMLDEPGQIEKFKLESPDLRFAVQPLPSSLKTEQSIAFGGGQMLAITKNTKHPKAAEKLIRFLVRPETAQAITTKITTLFPSHKDADQEDFYQKDHPELLVFLNILKNATSPPAHPRWIEIQEIFSEQLERIMYGLAEVEPAMRQAQTDIEAVLSEPDATSFDPDQSKDVLINPKNMGLLMAGIFLVLVLWFIYYALNQRKRHAAHPAVFQKRLRYHLNTFLFLLPWLFVFCFFSLFPILYSVFLSFTRFRATGQSLPKWVGISNYIDLLSDGHFINSVKNSLVFVAGTVPVILILAVILAVVLNQNMRFRTFYRVSYFMPVVTSVMVIATLFMELYAPTGFINDLLSLFGFQGKHWLKDPDWSLASIMWMNIWASFGFYTLMLLAGLQNIPIEYYEASKLDGATKFRQFFTITLPLLKPTILVAALMDTILAFQVFGEIFLMTKGGPLRTTETSVYYLYDVAFHKQKMGYGSAAAYYIFLILVLFAGAQFFLYRRKPELKN